MKRRILILCTLVGVCVFAAILYAQQQKSVQQLSPDRVDLETQTLVGKRLERTETGPNGEKIYHFLYRVEARQTAKSLPRYIVDHRYNITYTTEGFKTGDTITLLSTNEESETDSPIWVYNVTYVGGGNRKINFDTSGSVFAPTFTTVSGETDDPCTCVGCLALSNACSCREGCTCSHCPPCSCIGCTSSSCYLCPKGCSCSHCTVCNCIGCQSQNPKCVSCPQGCTCSHCRCACSGCLSQSPPCISCPPGCFCNHCGCLCTDDVDHFGVCGCALCSSPGTRCRCECHAPCP